jgi:hypothetical protein
MYQRLGLVEVVEEKGGRRDEGEEDGEVVGDHVVGYIEHGRRKRVVGGFPNLDRSLANSDRLNVTVESTVIFSLPLCPLPLQHLLQGLYQNSQFSLCDLCARFCIARRSSAVCTARFLGLAAARRQKSSWISCTIGFISRELGHIRVLDFLLLLRYLLAHPLTGDVGRLGRERTASVRVPLLHVTMRKWHWVLGRTNGSPLPLLDPRLHLRIHPSVLQTLSLSTMPTAVRKTSTKASSRASAAANKSHTAAHPTWIEMIKVRAYSTYDHCTLVLRSLPPLSSSGMHRCPSRRSPNRSF